MAHDHELDVVVEQAANARHALRFRLRASDWVCYAQVRTLLESGIVWTDLTESGVVVTS
jgi:hypothetical protein